MKKQVLFMIDSLRCGGAERSLVSLLSCLDYSIIDVNLIIVGRGGVFEKYLPKQVNIIPFGSGCKTAMDKFLFRLSRIRFSIYLRLNRFRKSKLNPPHLEWLACRDTFKCVTDKKFDVAIAYQQGFPTFYVMDKILASKKYLWLNQDIFKTDNNIPYLKSFYDRCNGVVTVSEPLYESVLAQELVGKDNLYCILDILSPQFIKKQSEAQLRIESVPDNCIVITTVARMVFRQKGQDLAIKAAAILKEHGAKFTWYIVGDGPDLPYLEKLIKDYKLEGYVIATGMQANPYPYIRMADIYVQTSRYEGFGLTLTEGKILGKPIVTTNFPTAFIQIQHGENGLITEMTPEAIADAVYRLITDSELRKKFSERNRAYVNETSITEAKKVMNLILS